MGEPKNTILELSQPEPGISIPAPGFVFGAEQASITGITGPNNHARKSPGLHQPDSSPKKNPLAGFRIFAGNLRRKQTRIKPAGQFIRAYSQVLSGIPDFQSRSRIHLYMIQAMANSLDPQAREDFLDLARAMARDARNLGDSLASDPPGLRDPGSDTINPKGKDAPCS